MDRENLLAWAKEVGFTDGVIVPAERMTFREEFRGSCEENRCHSYGKYWTCPPGAGSVQELIGEARSYRWLMMLDYCHPLEDCFDYEGMAEGGRVHKRITQRLADEAVEKMDQPYRIMGHSACDLCETCSYPDAPCRHPERAVTSISAFCVFVGETVRSCGLQYYTGEESVHYFTALLFEKK